MEGSTEKQIVIQSTIYPISPCVLTYIRGIINGENVGLASHLFAALSAKPSFMHCYAVVSNLYKKYPRFSIMRPYVLAHLYR